MVKQGFLNLSEAEQQRVLEAALDEFARYDFHSASLNRIIQKAGISKGSMYHYFHNKEDLYLYLLDQTAEKKKQFMAAALSGLYKPVHELGFFEILEFQVEAGVEFALQNPRLQKVFQDLESIDNQELQAKIKERLGGQLDDYVEDYLGAMVDRAVAAGELRADLDRNFLLRLLKFFFLNFIQIFPEARRLEDPARVQRELEQLLSFLKNGLQG